VESEMVVVEVVVEVGGNIDELTAIVVETVVEKINK
jgi:hypothetical protein